MQWPDGEFSQSLSPEDRQLYDDLLRDGKYTGSAEELLEIYFGREESLRQKSPTAIVKVS